MGEEAGKVRSLQRRMQCLFKEKQDLGSSASGVPTWRLPLHMLNRQHLGQDLSCSWILQLSTQWVKKEGLAGSPTQGWFRKEYCILLCTDSPLTHAYL